MPVKGCKDLYSSMDEYVKEETLDGDNQYHSERYGKQVRSSRPCPPAASS